MAAQKKLVVCGGNGFLGAYKDDSNSLLLRC